MLLDLINRIKCNYHHGLLGLINSKNCRTNKTDFKQNKRSYLMVALVMLIFWGSMVMYHFYNCFGWWPWLQPKIFINEFWYCILCTFEILPFCTVNSILLAIFYQFFIFSPNNSPSKTVIILKISYFLNFPFLSTLSIQHNIWKWNNLWCHELACINFQM